jgi:hypothetical protein
MGEAGSMTSFESIGVNLWFYSPDQGKLFEDLAYRAPAWQNSIDWRGPLQPVAANLIETCLNRIA